MIRETLQVDLSQIAAQLQQLQEQQRQTDSRTEQVQRRVQGAIQSVNELDRRSSAVLARLESKLRAQAKQAIQGGVALGLHSVLDSISLGDDPYSVAGSRIIASTVASGSLGGLPAATVAFITSSIVELKNANEETKRQLKAATAKLRADLESLREETYNLNRGAEERLEELAREIEADAEKLKAEAEELDYQTSQYAE